jgi:predicted lipoprotein
MFKKILKILTVTVLINACSSSNEAFDDLVIFEDDFDRGLMLTNIADNIIIPSYEDFSDKMTSMKLVGQNFINSPDQITLDAFRTSWYNAYKTWQHVEMFNLGKAEELQYGFYMNVYPLAVTDVENNILDGGYELNSVNNHDAQGLPALD